MTPEERIARQRAYQRAYYLRHKDEVKKKNLAFYYDNQEKCRAYQKAYRSILAPVVTDSIASARFQAIRLNILQGISSKTLPIDEQEFFWSELTTRVRSKLQSDRFIDAPDPNKYKTFFGT